MRLTLLIVCLIALTGSVGAADDAGSKCVTTESDVVFRTKDVVVSDANLLARYPTVEVDATGKPVGLVWYDRAFCEAASEKIAEKDGKEIRRFVFWEKGGHKDGDGVVCVWFGYQTAAPSGGMAYRPFLIFRGDEQVRWWESFCSHDEQDGFTVSVEITAKGNGVMWARAIVGFKDGEPAPLRIESGGRRRDEPDVTPYH